MLMKVGLSDVSFYIAIGMAAGETDRQTDCFQNEIQEYVSTILNKFCIIIITVWHPRVFLVIE